MVGQPHTIATPNPSIYNANPTQPWTAPPWYPSALAPDATRGVSTTNYTPTFQYSQGTPAFAAGGDRDRTDTVIQSSQNKTPSPANIPHQEHSEKKFVFLNESFLVPDSTGSLTREDDKDGSTPGELDMARESDRDAASSTLPERTEWDPHGDVPPSSGTDGEQLSMEEIPAILRDFLSPTVRADLTSKIQPPWTQHGKSKTISQTEISTLAGEESPSSHDVETRTKPAWILDTLTPAEPPKDSALLCPLGTYVIREIIDGRYGPASTSTKPSGEDDGPSFKRRMCFVTFQNGPYLYVAPVLGSTLHKVRRPFLTNTKGSWDWWLPVTWVALDPAKQTQAAPMTPDHPRELKDGYRYDPDSPAPKFAMPDQPGVRRRIEIEYGESPFKVKSCFIWSGDPGDRISRLPRDARIAEPQARYLPHREIYEKLFVCWNALWESGIEPPRPKSEWTEEDAQLEEI
uniref:Protein kinase domain-containing protein n=1 Tax=Ganoderma boninense TaxID=34458 RepID=A0A5K1JTP2_9APHY|nr:Protein kinase domain-containing protein [Ganoderma boninense]